MIEVLKQALEALEQVTKELLAVRDELAERGARPTTNVFHQRLWDSSFSAYTDHAIPAAQSLRQAIAELESQEPIYQYQLASGAWIDQTKESHDYNVRHGQATVRVLYTHPPQRTEPVAFKIYKPTPPRHAIPNVRDAELPWVYDQDPSSGNVASMWVTPVKHTRPPQRTEQEPVQEPKNYRHTWGKDGEGCVICGDKDWMNTSCKPLAPQRTEQKPVKWADYEPDGMHHNKPTPQRTWVGSGDLEDSNSYLNTDEKNT